MYIRTYIVMDCNEIEEMVKRHFGKDINVIAAEEWSNDEAHEYWNITTSNIKNWPSYQKNKFDKFIQEGQSSFGFVLMILEYFVSENILPEGNYLIEIDW